MHVTKHINGLNTYGKYFAIGSIVGILAILVRELIAWLLPADTPVYYGISITLVYVIGIIASYLGHYHVTFSHIENPVRQSPTSIRNYILIALIGMLITTVLSYVFRYVLQFDVLFGKLSASAAFALAALVASGATYFLNATYIFIEDSDAHGTRKCKSSSATRS